jgi:MFS family permease
MGWNSRRSETRLSSTFVRGAMWHANANAAVWAVGNGLVSTLLVIYLANELGATGVAASLILAAPRFAGLLRLAVPALIRRVASRKAVCIGAFLASTVVLCVVPAIALRPVPTSPGWGLTTLVIAWCVYHLLEYVGVVALWSWLGDLTPRRIRGRLLGRREQWQGIGRVAGMATSIGLALLWRYFLPTAPRLQPLALSAFAGAVMMMVSVAPLVAMPSLAFAPSAVPRAPWRSLVRPVTDRVYRRLILFWFWFSTVNGLTTVAQELYPIRVLDVQYYTRVLLQGMMRAGQVVISPWMGQLVDRYGNRPVMAISQLIAASGLLFFLVATPQYWWLIAGAFVAWIAYAGLNVGLDSVKLKLAPPDNNSPYLAVFHATGDLANGMATVAGGVFYDQQVLAGTVSMSFYFWLFFLGWIGRTFAAVLIARLIEPGARELRGMLD